MVVEERVARLQNKCRDVVHARDAVSLGEAIVRRERTNERASRRDRENAETPYTRPGFAEAAPTCLLREQPREIPHFSHSARLSVSTNRVLPRGFSRSSQLPPSSERFDPPWAIPLPKKLNRPRAILLSSKKSIEWYLFDGHQEMDFILFQSFYEGSIISSFSDRSYF